MSNAPKIREEVRAVRNETPGCRHRFGPLEPGRFAQWVRRCRRCRAVATIRIHAR